jgi:RHS repeat-associated protein
MGSDTILFVGNYFEQKGSTVTKYYFAGASRIALRKYTIPQNMTVEYMLGDHLGSTSITTDTAGAKISEMRYKAWGETRYSWTNAPVTTPTYELTKYQYTGQYSYTTEFGLHFYGARFYDSGAGRFVSADIVIPQQTQGTQAWDRYAYTNNNPVRYNDPTGHWMTEGDGGCNPDVPGDCDPPSQPRDPGDKDKDNDGIPDTPDMSSTVSSDGSICYSGDLIECLYSGSLLPNGDIIISDDEWEMFVLALYLDILGRAGDGFWTFEFNPGDREWPFIPFHTEGYYQREGYDTPFWNGYTLTGNACFSSGNCYNRNDVNYIAQGMWSAAAHEGPWGAQYIANKWKQMQYGKDASPGVLFWVHYVVAAYYNMGSEGIP